MKYKFEVLGEPQGKARPRFNSKTKSTYTLGKTVQYENKIMTAYLNAGGNKFDSAVCITIVASFGIPKSTSNVKRCKMLTCEILPEKRPDIDNIVKAVLDGLNGVAYADDKQVTDLFVIKRYSNNPKIEIMVEAV